MAFEGPLAGEALLAGRVLFASVLGVLAVGNLLDHETTVAYAESKGAPLAPVAVPLASLSLLSGAVAIAVGAFPALGAAIVVGFLVAITPVMHDFWNQEGMDRQNEQIHFLKNAGLLGTALVFLALAGSEWPYALGPALV